MFRTFNNIDTLIAAVAEDKKAEGEKGVVLNRYPIRFVMFDNFNDCYDFIDHITGIFSLHMQSIEEWFDAEYPDAIVSHSMLATALQEYVENTTKDSIISPFSEIARFYDDNPGMEFRALISTIKGIQSSKEAWKKHLRIYVPIVGMVNKMALFEKDSQSTIWYLKSASGQCNYNLVLLNGETFGIDTLSKKYTTVYTVFEWLKIWRDREITRKIICKSKSLFAYRENTRPDNAFEYTICENVYDFLSKGLGLDVSFATYSKDEDMYWMRFANEIDINDFNLYEFINKRFGIHELSDYNVFNKLWFSLNDPYERWLLCNYYTYKFCNKGYTCIALLRWGRQVGNILTYHLLDTIFDLDNPEEYLEERRIALKHAAKYQASLPATMGSDIVKKINKIVDENGHITALRYVSTITYEEKTLLIQWLADGYITLDQVVDIYPDLGYYMSKTFGTKIQSQLWCLSYIDSYKKAKLANKYLPAVKTIIVEKNADEVAFNNWYDDFKTVRTELSSRNDIDVFFWIDGLGMEWIPLINQVLKEKESDGYFLNEIIIAKSLLPTTTENNKQDFLKLTDGSLSKNGDLDSISHKVRKYPYNIIFDISLVRECITKILNDNPKKKIAIISDHGISYMPQLCQGINLSGVNGDHSGRLAVWNNGTPVHDPKYKVLDDGSTICALTHESLTSKVDAGTGCHGGCTPEEVLVPIFIISGDKIASYYTATLLTSDISAASPVLKFNIKGVRNIDDVYVEYDGNRYELVNTTGDIYESEALRLRENITKVTLLIGLWTKDYYFKASLGAEEDNIFDF